MRKLAIALAALMLSISALGQVSYDTVTATVTDPDGQPLANAPFIWRLVDQIGNPVSSATTPNGQIYNAKSVQGTLSGDGTMSVGLVPNNILTKPSGTQWRLTISPPLPVDQSNILTYQPPWNLNYTASITANVDLSSQISALTSNVNYFNVQTGQATVAGWLTGTAGPPSLLCGSMSHAGYFYMSAAAQLYQCNKAVGGVWAWNGVAGTGTAGLVSLNGLVGPNLNLVSSDSSILISPSGTSIDLKVIGGGGSGVQYNPTTTSYIVPSFSGPYDDGDAHSTNLGVPTSVNCVHTTTSTCTVVMPTAHGLAVAGAIDMFNLASWPYVQQAAQYGSFQVTTVPNSTTITFTTPTTLTYTCGPCTGNVYDASFWGIWEFAREPFIYGHGTVYGLQQTSASLVANWTALTSVISGTPKYLIDQTGQNDFAAGSSTATVESLHQQIWALAHTDGMITVQSTMVPSLYGFTPADVKPSQLNYWYFSQACTPSNKASKQCIDRYIDTASVLQTTENAAVMPEPGANQRFADKLNEAFGVQKSSAAIPPTQVTFSGNLSTNIASEFTGNRRFFYDANWNTWMDWNPTSNGATIYSNSHQVVLNLIDSSLGAGGNFGSDFFGRDGGNNNVFGRRFHYAGNGSTSNYAAYYPIGGTDVIRFFADGSVQLPNVATSPSTAPACFNGTNGGLTNVGCTGGGLADPGSNGVVKRTALNTTAVAAFADIVAMWASGACTSGYLKFDGTCSAPSGTFAAGGDLAGTSSSQQVIGINSVPLCTGFSPTNGQNLQYTTASTPNPCYTAQTAPSGSFAAGGDLSGTSTSQQVTGLKSVPFCTGFTPTTGQVLTYTTASSPNPCYTAASAGGGASFPFTIVQQSTSQFNNGTSFTVSFPQALQASGATAFIFLGYDTGATVTMTGWTRDFVTSAGGPGIAVYHIASAGQTSVTFTTSGTVSCVATFLELSGTRSIGASAFSTFSSAVSASVGSITPSAGAAVFEAVSYTGLTTAPQFFPNLIGDTLDTWRDFGYQNGSGNRSLSGYVYKGAATGATITPPRMLFPGVFSGNWAAWSIN
jgi:hypothetical protein